MTNLGRHLPEDALAGLVKNAGLAKLWKSPEQGAATTVWAATAKALDGNGG